MPASLADYYTSSKVELFNMWLDSGKDWSAVELTVERIQEQKSISKKGWVAVQGKELKKRYSTEEKWEAVKTDRKNRGLFYEDDDFPDDDDDTYLHLADDDDDDDDDDDHDDDDD